jgi:hypothetical protein
MGVFRKRFRPAKQKTLNPLWIQRFFLKKMVGRAGFEPAYSMRADLQSAAFNHSATYPVSLARGGMFGFGAGC